MMKGVNFTLAATNKSAPAFSAFERSLQGIHNKQKQLVRSNRSMMRGMSDNRRIIQQVGMQVSDFSVQIAGGQSAILSFTQNVPQIIQFFGAWGGILAGVITVLGTLTYMLYQSGKGFSDLMPYLGVTQDEFRAIGNAINAVKNAFFDSINFMVNHLDVLFISISLVAGFMATKWIASFVAAGKVTGAFVAIVNMLRAALIRLGIGAIIVGLGYLIERLMAVNSVTGSWGETLGIVGDLAKQTFFALPKWIEFAIYKWLESMASFSAFYYRVMGGLLSFMPGWSNSMIGFFVGLGAAIVEIFKAIPPVVGSMIIQAGNMIIAGFENILGLLVGGLNAFINTANSVLPDAAKMSLIAPPAISRIENQWAGAGQAAGEAISGAFNDSMNTKFVGKDGIWVQQFKTLEESARALSENFKLSGDSAFQAAMKATPAWQKLQDILSTINDKTFDIRDLFGAGSKTGESSTEGDTAGKSPIEEVKYQVIDLMEMFEDLAKKISNGLKGLFKDLLRGTKSMRDVMVTILDTILDKVLDIMLTPLFDSLAGGIAGGLGSIFGLSSPAGSFDGGGFTGMGARVGGVDGKGGKLAVVHPNETILDHTKGQGMGGTSVTINVNGVQDVNSFNKSRHQIVRDIRNAMGA